MAEVIDFFKAKATLEFDKNIRDIKSSTDDPEYLRFLESCIKLRELNRELSKSNFSLLKTDGEIL